ARSGDAQYVSITFIFGDSPSGAAITVALANSLPLRRFSGDAWTHRLCSSHPRLFLLASISFR
ncbi:unnamed protein product, partial [Brassica napus]